MRAGACAAQQTLTAEAASVLKHSLSLARRRGHAQITPLHVAATLLSSRTSLLRRACLKSQPLQSSHPLQCRALELCFSVALNRIPNTPGSLLHGQPSFSNALIAALKRAQAHQRRGCIEQQQQQPLLTIKVELEQLIISILDDPSVSRVMREAGFSSPAVKNNLEDSSASSVFQCYNSSGGVFSSPCSPYRVESRREIINPSSFWQTRLLSHSSDQNPVLFSPHKKVSSDSALDSGWVKEDVNLVFDVLLKKKRRNTVIVGDSEAATEGLVADLSGRIERGEIPEELKQTHFIKFQFSPVALRFMKREDVEMNVSELKRKIDSLALGGEGSIIFTGDLKWTVEDDRDGSIYSPVGHLIVELGRLLAEYNSLNSKVWLMATASYQTYMRCQMRQPSLEVQWAFQAVSVPSSGLKLSLHASSAHDSRNSRSQLMETKSFANKEEQDKLTCCQECSSNYEKEAQLFKSGHQKLLPSWLQSHAANDPKKDDLLELRRKWNRFCHNLHQHRHVQSHHSSAYRNSGLIGKGCSYGSSKPWWPNQNTIFPNSNPICFSDLAVKDRHSSNSIAKFRRQNSCTIEFNFGNGTYKHEAKDLSLGSLKNSEEKDVKITLALGNSLAEAEFESTIQSDDLGKILIENVSWQSETISSMADVLIESNSIGNETWLLIQGNDTIGKRRFAKSVAESLFGSADLLLEMNMKDKDSELNPSEILEKALKNQKKLVLLVENVDLAETQFIKFLSDRFETGNFGGSKAIFILSTGDSVNIEQDYSVVEMNLKLSEAPEFEKKRKADWDFSVESKTPRSEDKEDASSGGTQNRAAIDTDFSRQSSFSTLDLNIRADEDDETGEKPGEFSAISGDSTNEIIDHRKTSSGLIRSVENRFIFDKKPGWNREMKDVLLSKIKGAFGEVYGVQNTVNFTVEERVLEEMVVGSSSFLNTWFEKWLKQIFQTTLETVKMGGKKGMGVIRLAFGGKEEKGSRGGFLGSILPKKIKVYFVE